MGGVTAPAQSGLLGRAGLRDRAGFGSARWGWEGLAAEEKGWRAGRGCMGFAVWNSRVSFVPCGKVPEGKTCKDIETPHRADGSYPGLDCAMDYWIAGWKQKQKGGLNMLGKKEVVKRRKYFAEFLCQKDGKEYVVAVPGYFGTKEEAELRLTKFSVYYFTSKNRKDIEYLGSNIYSRFVCG